ncbi:MAG: prepilin-type N-terminal cleavage/methylation domain-containing protein, partial [Rhodospirillales bacterium]|nr:prepilin-type N-terminal cleavage/methylation domain-containing protein [Rhodospirillales bacterium]
MTRARRQSGMTLVELVVALGLLALLVGSLAAALG